MNKQDFNSFYFHDGQLLSYCETYNTEDLSFQIVVEMALYENHQAAKRDNYTFIFEHIKRATKMHHFHDHKFHFEAGNISNGFKNGKNTYLIYLCSGLIEIEARKLTINKNSNFN